MDEIERPPMPENQSLNIYDARVTFRGKGQEKKVVTVVVRYSKRGHIKKREILKDDTEDGDLCWKLYHKEHIAVYHRREANEYVDMNHSITPTSLGQKLEGLVCQAHEEFMKYRNKKHT